MFLGIDFEPLTLTMVFRVPAVGVMKVFDSKFLSSKQNMNFVKRSFQLDKTS